MTDTADLRRTLLADEVERDRLDRAVRNGRGDLTAQRDAAATAAEATRAALDAAIVAEPPIWPTEPQLVPALLVPWRLEVRYLTGAAGGPELGVRAVPDDVAVHTFEPELTTAEREAGKRYWDVGRRRRRHRRVPPAGVDDDPDRARAGPGGVDARGDAAGRDACPTARPSAPTSEAATRRGRGLRPASCSRPG